MDPTPPPSSPRGPFVFPRWTNALRPLAAVAAVGGLVYAVVVLTLLFSPKTSAIGYAPEQPVAYSHALHAGQMSIDCRYCHDTIEHSARAALPSAATCMNCHKTVRAQSEKLAAVRAAYETGAPLRWKRVHDLPDFVYFDHSAHLNGGISCVTCHGRVDRMDVVRQEAPLNMKWCLECHRDPAPFVRPREFVTDLAWTADAATPSAAELIQSYDLTPSVDCSTCHR